MVMFLRAMQKWDYEAHEYKQIFVPAHLNCKLYSDNPDETVNCPHCGKALPWGETYTSMEIHNDVGLGYAVCAECHSQELQRRLLHREQENNHENNT